GHLLEDRLETVDGGRRSVPGEDPLLRWDRPEDLVRQIPRGFEVDQVVALRRGDQPLLAALRRALERAALGPAAQGVQQLAGKLPAQRRWIEVPDEITPDFEPGGALDAVQRGKKAGNGGRRQGRHQCGDGGSRVSVQKRNLLPGPEGGDGRCAGCLSRPGCTVRDAPG